MCVFCYYLFLLVDDYGTPKRNHIFVGFPPVLRQAHVSCLYDALNAKDSAIQALNASNPGFRVKTLGCRLRFTLGRKANCFQASARSWRYVQTKVCCRTPRHLQPPHFRSICLMCWFKHFFIPCWGSPMIAWSFSLTGFPDLVRLWEQATQLEPLLVHGIHWIGSRK